MLGLAEALRDLEGSETLEVLSCLGCTSPALDATKEDCVHPEEAAFRVDEDELTIVTRTKQHYTITKRTWCI